MTYEIEYRPIGANPRSAEATAVLVDLLRAPLYKRIPVTKDLMMVCLGQLYTSGFRLDEWCIACKKESTFTLEALLDRDTRDRLEARLSLGRVIMVEHRLERQYVHERLRWMTFRCARNPAHHLSFICCMVPVLDLASEPIKVTHYDLFKIGQQPSPADIAKKEIRKYANTLGEPYFGEFNRAIGLASHDVGIGSFVYLRRIFERLVEQTLSEAVPDPTRQSEIRSLRMRDKIKELSRHLPDFLVENDVLYPILSLGVHELEEQQCLGAFESVKVGIELILDQKLEKQAREKKIKEAGNSLANLQSKLGSSGNK